jgi:hypothetical protein
MDIDLKLVKTGSVSGKSPAELIEVLSDMPATLSHFPKLRPITELAANRYRWDLEAIGAAGVEHEVSFATDFETDVDAGEIRFSAVKGEGNAMISGVFRAQESGGATELVLEVGGTLSDIKVPMLLRGPAKPFIKGMFEKLVDRFVERVSEAHG